MDFHSRTLGRHSDGRRYLRRPRDWKEYLACADIVQMNEIEFELLSGKKATRKTTCEFLLEHMKKSHCLVVTRGAEGCMVVRRRGKSAATSLIQSFRVETVVDTTGCGDIFSAGFVADYLISHNPISAAGYGNLLAGARCRQGDLFKVDIAQLLSVRAATSKGDFRTPKRNI